MKQTLITTVLALGLGFLSAPSFASSYIVNGRAASPAEAQHLVASGVQPGAWVVNGYGIAPAAAERALPLRLRTNPAARGATTSSTYCSATDRQSPASRRLMGTPERLGAYHSKAVGSS